MMKYSIIWGWVALLTCGCMMPDYPDAPVPLQDDTAGDIRVLQVIDKDEVLAYYNNKLGHFTIKNMNTDIVVDDGIYSVKGVKQVGVYRYSSAFGTVRTVPDYTINNDMNLDAKNAENIAQYNENFPESERKTYQPIFCGGLGTIIYTPLSIFFSPVCMLGDDCYFRLKCFTDEELNVPYKDR